MYAIIESIVLSSLTLLFAMQGSLSGNNLTGIANQQQRLDWFLAWSVIAAFFFVYHSFKIFQTFHWQPRYLRPLATLIFLSGISASLIPYQEGHIHLQALHVLLAMFPCVAFCYVLERFFLDQRFIYPQFCQIFYPCLQLIFITLLILITIYGHINSIIEILMVSLISLFIACVRYYTQKNELK